MSEAVLSSAFVEEFGGGLRRAQVASRSACNPRDRIESAAVDQNGSTRPISDEWRQSTLTVNAIGDCHVDLFDPLS